LNNLLKALLANFKRLLFLIILIAAAIGVLFWLKASETRPKNINGIITNISNQCHVDGTCSVTLDGYKTIVTGCGLTASGKTCKTYDQTKLQVGQRVNAIVVGGDNYYSVECDSCTILPE
jgi:hypothetical protein